MNELQYGDVLYLNCAYSAKTKKGYNCGRQLKVIFYANSSKVEVQNNGIDHSDDPTDEASALTREVKAIILEG